MDVGAGKPANLAVATMHPAEVVLHGVVVVLDADVEGDGHSGIVCVTSRGFLTPTGRGAWGRSTVNLRNNKRKYLKVGSY